MAIYVDSNYIESWKPASDEETAAIEAVWRQKVAELKQEPISDLPTAFQGFLDPANGLGSNE